MRSFPRGAADPVWTVGTGGDEARMTIGDESDRDRAARRRRTRLRLALGAVVIYAAMLGAANIILQTRYLPDLIARHDAHVTLSWDSVWMVIPGHVHVRNFRLAVQGHSASWQVVAEEASGRIALQALRRRRLEINGIRGDGVRFALRRRADRSEEAGPDIAPVRTDPPQPPGPQAPWQFVFHDGAVERIEEVWIGPWKLELGTTRLRADVEYQSRHRFLLDNARVEEVRGALALQPSGEEIELRGGHVHGSAHVTPGPDRPDNLDIVPALALEIELSLAVAELASLLRVVGEEDVASAVRGGASTAELVALVRQGDLRPGSRLEATGRTIEFPVSGGVVRGRLALNGVVEKGRGGVRRTSLHFDVGDPHFVNDAGRDFARAPRLTVEYRSEGPMWERNPVVHRLIAVRLPESAQVDLAALNQWTGDTIRFKEGFGRLALDLSWGPESRDHPQVLRFDADRFVAQVGTAELEGRLAASAGAHDPSLTSQTLSFGDVSVELSELAVISSGARVVEGWGGALTLHDAALGRDRPQVVGRLSGQVDSAAPIVELLSAQGQLPWWARRLRNQGPFDIGAAHVEATPDGLDLASLWVNGPRLSARGLLSLRDDAPAETLLLLRVPPLTIGFETGPQGSDVKLWRAHRWFRERAAAWDERVN